MKTIAEAAGWVEHNKGYLMSTIDQMAVESFKSGVKFAESWIDVNEELPEVKVKPYQALAMTANGEVDVFLILDVYDTQVISSYYKSWRPLNRE